MCLKKTGRMATWALSYLSMNQYERALRIFEKTVGFDAEKKAGAVSINMPPFNTW